MPIQPDRLRQLRAGKNLSRAALATKAGIAVRTIQRLENDSEPDRCHRELTVTRLAKALGVDPRVLTGDGPLPESAAPRPDDRYSVRVSARISPKARLAYELVRRRYGVLPAEILNAAPLFFVLLAEGSLACRRRNAQEAERATGTLDKVSDRLNYRSLLVGASQADNALLVEHRSIERADIFGKMLADGDREEGWEFLKESDDNPFVIYLRDLADEIGEPDIVDVIDVGVHDAPMPSYNVCADDLGRITNGSSLAKTALEHGEVRISDIPDELLADDAKEQRTKWIEDHAPKTREHRKDMARLAPDIFGPPEPGKENDR